MAFFTKMQHSNHALPVGSLLLGTWYNSFDVFRHCLWPYPTCLCLFQTCLCLFLTCLCIFFFKFAFVFAQLWPDLLDLWFIPRLSFSPARRKIGEAKEPTLEQQLFWRIDNFSRIKKSEKKNIKCSLGWATEGALVGKKIQLLSISSGVSRRGCSIEVFCSNTLPSFATDTYK